MPRLYKLPACSFRALPVLYCVAILSTSCSSSQDATLSSSQANDASASLSAGANSQGAWSPEVASGKCLTTAKGSSDNGTPVQISTCTDSNEQVWSYTNHTLRIFGNKCLDVTDGVVNDGTKLQIWDCVPNSRNQKWSREGNQFVFAKTYCLDVTDGKTDNGTQMQIWTCYSNNINQQWSIQPNAASSQASAPSSSTTSDAIAAAARDLNALMQYSSQSTYSNATVMGIHYATAANHVVTASELKFLSDPSAQPPSLGGENPFVVILYPNGAPLPFDVVQHGIGDCDGDAALASLAYMAPDFIKSIIIDNGNSTFTVKMFDPMGKPITVSLDNQFYASNANQLLAVSGQNGIATWSTVLEKAAMKYNAVYNIVADIGGIGSEFLLPMFTGEGNSFAFNDGALTPAQLTTVVKSALAQGMFLTGGFDQVMPLGIDESITAHGFSVFVPADGNTMVSMRNPWGVNETVSGIGYDTSNDGVLDIPISTDWSNHIDLRLIAPGSAGGPGRTSPYKVPKSLFAALSKKTVLLTEPHAAELRARKLKSP